MSSAPPKAPTLPQRTECAGSTVTQSYDWVHFAARYSSDGSRWVDEYLGFFPVVELSRQAVFALRSGDIDVGKDRLLLCRDALSNVGSIRHSVDAALRRWYNGAVGYFHYQVSDFRCAKEAMNDASECVAEAVRAEPFLIMFAADCQELCLHHARICRNAREWTEMKQLLQVADDMNTGRAPLCACPGGPVVDLDVVREFLHDCGPLTHEESRAVASYFDLNERRRLFDRFVRQLWRLPGIGIEYA